MAMAPTPAAPELIVEPGGAVPGPESHGASDASGDWPSTGSAYFALFAIILATFLTFFDQTVFGMLGQRIKEDFQLTDEQLGLLAGPSTVVFYVLVGIPMARLADIFPRKFVLAGGLTAISVVMTLGGMAQGFVQFVGSRMFLGAGGSAHAPSSYSLLADAFPPNRITRAFALLQLGFIGGTTIGLGLGGKLVMESANWGGHSLFGLPLHGWQWLLIGEGAAGILVALLLLMVREPRRRIPAAAAQGATQGKGGLLTFMGLDALKAIHARGRVFYPLFAALALSAVETFGLAFWRVPFMIRSYGWDEGKIGMVMAPMMLASQLLGVFFGGVFIEWGQALQGRQRARRGDPVRPGHDLRDRITADAHGRSFAGGDGRGRGVRPGRRGAAERRDPAHRPQCHAGAGDGVLPVHVHILWRDGQPRGGLGRPARGRQRGRIVEGPGADRGHPAADRHLLHVPRDQTLPRGSRTA